MKYYGKEERERQLNGREKAGMSFIYAIEEWQYTLDEYLAGFEENPRDKEIVLRLNATDIAILGHIGGGIVNELYQRVGAEIFR